MDIYISVRDGRVVLNGRVDNLTVRRAVALTARDTTGVRQVENRLRVRPGVVPLDTHIARHVRAGLARDPYVEGLQIAVAVEEGVVTLAGLVDTPFEKIQAESVVSRLDGVLAVVNQLAVSQDSPLTYDLNLDER